MAEGVELRGITKTFGDVTANFRVDLTLRAGEIHALLGENGAGKTTLMNILAGLYQPDDGQILVEGERLRFRSPRDAIDRGVGMVHQQFELIETFTATENFILGQPTGTIHRARLGVELVALGERLGLHVDPHAFIWQLSVGERQRVEILRLLHRGARILILDEPTAVLTPQEAESLFEMLRRLAGDGQSVVLITHKLDEVMRVADRITILRRGRVIAQRRRADTSPEELAHLMVGRSVIPQREKGPSSPGPILLQVQEVSALSDRGHEALHKVSFEVRGGEILGVAGVAGNGQRELADVIAGLRPLTSGRIMIDGVDVTRKGVGAALKAGLGYVPEDRLAVGMAASRGLADNMILRCYRTPPVGAGRRLNRKAAYQWTEQLTTAAQVQAPSLDVPVRLLSGGNQQRALMAREIAVAPRVLLAVYPTRGLDVAATERVHTMLLELRAQGSGIVLVSEDLDEVLTLSDRVLVLLRGRVTAVRPAADLTREAVGMLMGGAGPLTTR